MIVLEVDTSDSFTRKYTVSLGALVYFDTIVFIGSLTSFPMNGNKCPVQMFTLPFVGMSCVALGGYGRL